MRRIFEYLRIRKRSIPPLLKGESRLRGGFFLLVFFILPFVASAQQPYARYCPDPAKDLFSGIIADRGGSPKIELAVDPAFNDKMKRERLTGDLPVAPIYDLVFTAVPGINEYCLPQYDAGGNLIRKVDPPKTLPFTASIELKGKSLISTPSLQWNGKRDEDEQPLYEWKMKGWESGIVSENKMERLIRAVHDNDPSLKLVVEWKRKDGGRERAERAANFALCAPVWGNGGNQMVYSRVVHRLSDFTYQAKSIVEQGFLKVDPFRAYKQWFSHILNLRNYQVKGWTNIHLDAKEGEMPIATDCGNDRSTHISISPLVPPDDFASALFSGRFIQIASDVTKRIQEAGDRRVFPFFFSLPMPLIALHEIAHAFASVQDEYVALVGLSTPGRNCANFENGLEFARNGIRYGDRDVKGCYGSESYRPSQKSLMRGAQSGETRFNVVSCGYLVAAIKGLDVKEGPLFWEECNNPAWNTIKPTGKTSLLGSQLASIFSSLFSSHALPPASISASVGAAGSGEEILIEHWSEDGTITGETISVPAIRYVPMPLADVPADDDTDITADGGGDEPIDGISWRLVRGGQVMELFDETGRVYKTIPLPYEEYVERESEGRLIDALYERTGDLERTGFTSSPSLISRAVTAVVDAVENTISRITRKSVIPSVERKAEPVPLRSFTLNIGEKPLTFAPYKDASGKLIEAEGELAELSSGQVKKTWKIKYEQKGHSRQRCDPPMFNLTFDKKDKKGNPRPLFSARSTYDGRSALEYQKVRFIPECDIWNTYFASSELSDGQRSGFDGKLNVLMLEYLVHAIFRHFGIPTSDVLGVASVRFIGYGEPYDKEYRYLMIQRTDEQDDQIPFTEQFNLEPKLFESGVVTWGAFQPDSEKSHRLLGVTLVDNAKKQNVRLDFDAAEAIRLELLTAFLKVGDRKILDNEDYGKDIKTGLWKTIPFGFDSSFNCIVRGDSRFGPFTDPLDYYIKTIPEAKQDEYKRIYAAVARDIFGNPSSLQSMLSLVDGFPFDGGKELTREYLRLSFDRYARYFHSPEFATFTGQPRLAPPQALSFLSEADFTSRVDAFWSRCKSERVTAPFTVAVASTSPLRIDDKGNNMLELVASYIVDVTTGATPATFMKEWAFNVLLLKEGSTDAKSVAFNVYQYPRTPLKEVPGPTYTLPAHTTTRFVLTAKNPFQKSELPPKGMYYAELVSVNVINDYKPVFFQPPSRTNSVSFGATATSPRIERIEPPAAAAGEPIVIHGTSFTSADNTVVFEDAGYAVIERVPSSDGTTLSVRVPRERTSGSGIFRGEVRVGVMAGNSPSNLVRFVVLESSASSTNLSVSRLAIVGEPAGAGRFFTGKLKLGALIRNEGAAIAQTFKNTLQYRTPGGAWTDGLVFEIPGLSAGISADVTYDWAGSAGEWELRILVDSGNIVAEIDEGDNASETFRASFVSRGETGGNAQNGAARLRSSRPIVSGIFVGFGKLKAGMMTFASKATNTGDGVSRPFKALLQYSRDGEYWSDWVQIDLPPLGAGQTADIKYSWTGGEGVWFVRACDDVSDECSPSTRFEVVGI